MFTLILDKLLIKPHSRMDLKEVFGHKKASGYMNRTLSKLQSLNLIEHTIGDRPNHPNQKFKLTKLGLIFIGLVNENAR